MAAAFQMGFAGRGVSSSFGPALDPGSRAAAHAAVWLHRVCDQERTAKGRCPPNNRGLAGQTLQVEAEAEAVGHDVPKRGLEAHIDDAC